MNRHEAAPLRRLLWRWHFIAGLLSAPFLILLAATGLVMAHGDLVDGPPRLDPALGAKAAAPPFPALARAASDAAGGGRVLVMELPQAEDAPVLFRVADGGGEGRIRVALDPRTGAVLQTVAEAATLAHWANRIHGTLLAGGAGDLMIEAGAGFGLFAIASGLPLWFACTGANAPGRRGRWLGLHRMAGISLAVLLLMLLLTGMAWTPVWGGRMVQAWSTFPAEKMAPARPSAERHGDLGHDGHGGHDAPREAPWALEQAHVPLPGPGAMNTAGSGTPPDLDRIVALARAKGFSEAFRVMPPRGDGGVFTIAADTMNGDAPDPSGDRTMHVDPVDGSILADIRFADYGIGGKAMALGVAVHKGMLGPWNVALVTIAALGTLFMAASGLVMWGLRRPVGSLAVPALPRGWRPPVPLVLGAAAICLLFPLSGIVAACVLAADLSAAWRTGA